MPEPMTPKREAWLRRQCGLHISNAKIISELLDALAAERDAREAAEKELAKWKPLTPEEAEKAYAEAEAVPMSEEGIQRIMKVALDPAATVPNSEQSQLAVRISDLRIQKGLLIARAEAAEKEREQAISFLDEAIKAMQAQEEENDGLVAERDALKAEVERLRAAMLFEAQEERCGFTHNPCGTDTWLAGHECNCGQCQRYLRRMKYLKP